MLSASGMGRGGQSEGHRCLGRLERMLLGLRRKIAALVAGGRSGTVHNHRLGRGHVPAEIRRVWIVRW